MDIQDNSALILIDLQQGIHHPSLGDAITYRPRAMSALCSVPGGNPGGR